MTHEYDDPFTKETIEKAVAGVLTHRRESSGAPSEQHGQVAIHEHFSS